MRATRALLRREGGAWSMRSRTLQSHQYQAIPITYLILLSTHLISSIAHHIILILSLSLSVAVDLVMRLYDYQSIIS